MEPTEQDPSADQETGKRRGRPPGSGFGRVDAPLLEQMRQLLDEAKEPTPEAAARRVAAIWRWDARLESQEAGQGLPQTISLPNSP